MPVRKSVQNGILYLSIGVLSFRRGLFCGIQRYSSLKTNRAQYIHYAHDLAWNVVLK